MAGDFCDLKHQSPRGCTALDAHKHSPVTLMLSVLIRLPPEREEILPALFPPLIKGQS